MLRQTKNLVMADLKSPGINAGNCVSVTHFLERRPTLSKRKKDLPSCTEVRVQISTENMVILFNSLIFKGGYPYSDLHTYTTLSKSTGLRVRFPSPAPTPYSCMFPHIPASI